MTELPARVIQCSVLMIGALMLLGGCGGGSSTASPAPIPVPGDPPDFSAEFPWRINTLTIPEWYTTLTTQPLVAIEGEVASWSWTFGTGAIPATSTEAQPILTLQDPGDYTAILTITDGAGHTGRIPVAYRVLPPAAPVIEQVTPNGEAGGEFTQATFGVTTSGPPVISWRWDFGDGALPSESTDAAPQVELQHIGGHTGTVEVCGPFGCSEREFGYGIRAPQAVWQALPLALAALPQRIAMCAAPDGSPRMLLTQEDAVWLAQPSPTASGSTDFWSIRSLMPLAKPAVASFAVQASHEGMYLFISHPDYPVPVVDTTLSRISFDGLSVWTAPLSDIGGLYDATTDATRLYLAVEDETDDDRPSLLSFQLGDLEPEGAPQPVTSWEHPEDWGTDLLGFGMRSIDGVLYQAHVRAEGAQRVEPGTLVVGRLTGQVTQGESAWVMVDLDASARGCSSMAWIETDSGLHLLYGVYHDTGKICDSDGFCTPVGSDFGVREAWTANREFESVADWQTGRSPVLVSIGLVSEIRGEPMLVRAGGKSLSLARGFSRVAGDIPWQRQFLEIGTVSLDRVASASSPDGAWVAGWDYQEWISWGGGNSGGGFSPSKPQFFAGRVVLQ